MIPQKRIQLPGKALRLALGGMLPLVVLFALGLAACGDTVSFTAANEAPKSGTSYMALQYDYDTTGKIRTHLQDSVLLTVDPTLPTLSGKGEVVPFAINSRGTFGDVRDTLYIHYEPNGDLSILSRGGVMSAPAGRSIRVPDTWIVMPFGSKVNQAQTVLDTGYTYSNTNIPVSIRITTAQEFIGPDLMAIAQGSLYLVRVKADRTVTVIEGNTRRQTVESEILSYSPKLGGIVQADLTSLSDIGSGLIERSHLGWILTAYTLAK